MKEGDKMIGLIALAILLYLYYSGLADIILTIFFGKDDK